MKRAALAPTGWFGGKRASKARTGPRFPRQGVWGYVVKWTDQLSSEPRPGVTCNIRSTQPEPAPTGLDQREGTPAIRVVDLVVQKRLRVVEL